MDGFSLIAGDINSNINVTGINIMDNPDTVKWLAKGTFVLSTGYFISQGLFDEHIVHKLYEQGCCGFGIKMNRYIDELPQTMCKEAEKYNFPIIKIPFSSSMDQIANLIYRKLYENEMNEIQRTSTIYKNISESVLKKNSIHNMLKILSTEVCSNVFLTDISFDVFDYFLDTNKFSTPLIFSKNATCLLNDDIINLVNTQIHLPVIDYQVNELNSYLYIYPIKNQQNPLAYLVFLSDNPTFHQNHELIKNVCSMFAICLLNTTFLTKSERNEHDIFFEKMLSTPVTDIKESEITCNKNNFDFEQSMICLVLNIPIYQDMSTPKKRAFERKIFSEIQDAFQLCTFDHTVYKSNFVFFVFPKKNMSQPIASNFITNISQNCINILTKLGIPAQIGTSKIVFGIQGIYTSYNQAIQALNLGNRISKSSFHNYYKDQIFHVFTNHFSKNEMLELRDETIGKLIKYDKQNSSDLLQTLKIYLEKSCNVSQTAELLYIHRNTMLYRLNQIKSILDVDINNEDEIFYLKLIFYIEKLL